MVVGLVAAAIAGIVAAVHTRDLSTLGRLPPDFDHLWYAARAMLHGRDPYPLIGPGREFEWPFRLSYPLPGLLLLTPFAALPLYVARALFVAVCVGTFAFAIVGEGFQLLPLLCSYSILYGVLRAQWTPLLAAALFLPALRFIYVAKPTVASALWLSRPSIWPIVSAAILIALSFVIQPHWLSEWLDSTRATPYFTLVARPGGFLILLALLRWKRPEARLLAAMACVPHTTVPYEGLYPMLVSRTRTEALGFALLSYVSWTVVEILQVSYASYAESIKGAGVVLVWALYMPALIVVLRRPNVGESSAIDPSALPVAGTAISADQPA